MPQEHTYEEWVEILANHGYIYLEEWSTFQNVQVFSNGSAQLMLVGCNASWILCKQIDL